MNSWSQRDEMKKVPYWRLIILRLPVNLTLIRRFLVGAYEMMHIFVYKGWGGNYNNYAENIWCHRTKFSRPRYVHPCNKVTWDNVLQRRAGFPGNSLFVAHGINSTGFPTLDIKLQSGVNSYPSQTISFLIHFRNCDDVIFIMSWIYDYFPTLPAINNLQTYFNAHISWPQAQIRSQIIYDGEGSMDPVETRSWDATGGCNGVTYRRHLWAAWLSGCILYAIEWFFGR